MYELLVLGLLMHWPLYPYLIAKIAGDIIGPWEKISRGSLSALITRLERAGYITEANPAEVPFPTERASHVYAMTAAGRARFHQLMMDTASSPGTYQRVFRVKALHLEFLSPEDQLYLVDHYIHYCQASVRYQQHESQDLATDRLKLDRMSQRFRETALEVMATTAEQWRIELAWARRLRDRIAAKSGVVHAAEAPSHTREQEER